LKEEFATKARKQLSESSDEIIDNSPHVIPQWASKKKKKKKGSRFPADLEIFASCDAESLIADVGDTNFCSRSEAICAELLRRYVPHFDLLEGSTFQVPVGRDSQGNTLAVDFLVDGVLFEYHPVRFFKNRRRCGDFKNQDEYRAYTKVFHSLSPERRDFFHDVMHDRLAVNYFEKRRAMLDKNPLFRRTELIVATSPTEFYHRVITRFGRNYPKSVDRFIKLFSELQHSLPE
jgi:hypothetical protein